jgi:hypothetical protein
MKVLIVLGIIFYGLTHLNYGWMYDMSQNVCGSNQTAYVSNGTGYCR